MSEPNTRIVHDLRAYGARKMRAEIADPRGKEPPADVECEHAFIADILDNDTGAAALANVRDVVSHKDFSVGSLGAVYRAVCALRDTYNERGEFDRVIATEEISTWLRYHVDGLSLGLDEVYLTEDETLAFKTAAGARPLWERVSESRSKGIRVEVRAQRLRMLGQQRRIVERLYTTAAVGFVGDPALFAESLQELSLAMQGFGERPRAESEHITAPLARVIEKYMRPGRVHEPFVTTGNPHLDEILELEPGDFVVIGARSGRGKSVLGLNAATATSEAHGPVLIFTGEMRSEQMALRALCAKARVDSHRIKRGTATDTETIGKLQQAIFEINRSRTHLTNITRIDVAKLAGIARRECKRIKSETGQAVRMIVVDYLQRVKPGNLAAAGSNREQMVSAVAFELKELAMELGVVLVSPAQLNADADKRDDSRPQVSDLRESKGIENEADAILLIHNPHYVERSRKIANGEVLDPEPCEITVGKSRSGKVGTAYAFFEPPFTRFEPFTASQVEAVVEEQRSKAEAGRQAAKKAKW